MKVDSVLTQLWRYVTNLNFWPRSGWKGWVISKQSSPASSCRAVDGIGQRLRGTLGTFDQREMPRLAQLILFEEKSLQRVVSNVG
jgi:hypothetical protein